MNQTDRARIRDQINALRGFYANSGAQIYFVEQIDYLAAAASDGVSVPRDSMGFITPQNRLFLNAGELETVRSGVSPYLVDGSVTTLHGPTFFTLFTMGFTDWFAISLEKIAISPSKTSWHTQMTYSNAKLFGFQMAPP